MSQESTELILSMKARIARARGKLAKRIKAISNDLKKIAEAEALAAKVQPLLPIAAKTGRGATVLRGTDWSTGEPIELPLDPAKPARQQVEAIFTKAKRMRRGQPVASARLAEAERAVGELDACEAVIDQLVAPTGEDLDAMQARIAKVLPHEVRPASGPVREREATRALPYRAFVASTGVQVLVGKGAANNDELTFRVAKPYHLWMHARGVPGAHVIVPLKRDQSCPADVLIDAAHLAAHFSDARGETTLEITTALRKHIRKPRGGAPGLVMISPSHLEKVVSLRVEPERLAKLLASET